MTGAVEKNSDDTVISQTTYTYDALGNRIGMDENGTQTWTLYDGSDPIMDFNGSGSLEMRYLNGPAGDLVDTVLARESAGGTVAWYLPDRLGTIRDLINSSGSIIDHVDYSAFGTVLDQSDPSEGDRMMGFAGMELDSVTGMNLAVYRVQDPGTGRWTSQDPLGFGAGDADLDRYVANDPIEGSDPSGLEFGLQPDPLKWKFTGGPEAEQAYFQELLRRLKIAEARLNRLKATALWGCVAKSQTMVIPQFDEAGRNQGGPVPHPLRGKTYWVDGKLFMVVDPSSPENQGTRQLLYAIIHEMMHAALMLGCKLELQDGTPIGNPDSDPNAEKNIQKYLKRILDDPLEK
jgi:RHS repeat-associated protein